jgi:threonyl-tRNA synthetase
MRIITLHCDFIKFKATKKAIKEPESPVSKEEITVKEPLVVLTAVESSDSEDTVSQLVKAVKKTATDVKAKNIVLYPYAHLSSNLAPPNKALDFLKQSEKALKKDFKVTRAPFGYYKSFELKCKGHPLAELSKEFSSASPSSPKMKLSESTKDTTSLLNEIAQTKLDTSKLKENDHRILGQKLGLFMFNESSPGMPYWLPNGFTVFNELVNFWREEHLKMGYKETSTPLINKSVLYKVSGHWDLYKDHMYVSEINGDSYGVKPMNCPNAMIIFKSKSMSYKELPYRISDTDRLHRYELSGTLNGLLRVRTFQQDDSHNFITEDMIKYEYEHIFAVCEKFYKIFNMKYSFKLGTRPKKFMGKKETWDKAEATLKSVLKGSKTKYEINEGDGAFYGPKVDIYMKDSLGREWQMGTVQLDYQMPQRFDLKYTDKDGKLKTPIVIHRVIYGSLERFIGVLLEHTNGTLPVWLSPVQARVISFTDRNEKAAGKILQQLKSAIPNLRADADTRSTTVNEKVRDAEMQRIPYIIVIGDKEEKSNTLAVRERGEKLKFKVKFSALEKKLKEKIQNRN